MVESQAPLLVRRFERRTCSRQGLVESRDALLPVNDQPLKSLLVRGNGASTMHGWLQGLPHDEEAAWRPQEKRFQEARLQISTPNLTALKVRNA